MHTIMNCNAWVIDYLWIGLHVDNMNLVPCISQPACDIGANEASAQAMDDRHGPTSPFAVFCLTVALLGLRTAMP